MTAAVFSTSDLELVGKDWLDQLKKYAEEEPYRRARFCLHPSTDDLVQEMIIAFCRDSLVPPHRHVDRNESIHVIEGRLAVIFLSAETGDAEQRLDLSPPGADGPFMYRINTPRWHVVVPLTEYVVVHEVSKGPFVALDDDKPPWGPNTVNEHRAYISKVLEQSSSL